MPQEIDLTLINEYFDDPANQDLLKLVDRFARAARQHFRGRDIDPCLMIEAAMTMVQAALRDVPEEDRDDVIQGDVIERILAFDGFLNSLGRPVEGEA